MALREHAPDMLEVIAHAFADWRERLTRTLARRNDSRWEPLTYIGPSKECLSLEALPRSRRDSQSAAEVFPRRRR